MALVVVATPGAANANSFVTRAEYEDYLDARLFVPDAVASADGTEKDKAITMATRVMNGELCWTGVAASATQALPWPRLGMFDRSGNAIATNVIPQALKDMTNELAFLLAQGDRTKESDVEAEGLKRVKAGPVDVEYKDDFTHKAVVSAAVISLGVPSWFCESTADDMQSFFQVL